MKNLFYSIGLLLVCSIATPAQQIATDAGTPSPGAISRLKIRELGAKKRTETAIIKQTLIYRGFFVDVARAENKSKLLSLRQSANERKDLENLYYEPRSLRPKGFTLFAISF